MLKLKQLWSICVLVFAFVCAGCGVKGDPTPPIKPVDLGRGRPNYKRATEEFAYPKLPPVHKDEDKSGENSEQGEE